MQHISWRKSSFSGNGINNECVELATIKGGGIHLRESDTPGAVLAATSPALAAFIRAAKAGEFDRLR
ncbi:DUF397 domain-containing protein [Streptomyces sp. NBRC 110028]|uniref:DUF397 domain-containing protein n=1 Tax=Streptomyces sp. NBRC 110028 TaxID=1621260 RepID=UPI0006E1A7D2|nr:DUF397 domain-containing protein [Streptomyces sp. NBRC 110028]